MKAVGTVTCGTCGRRCQGYKPRGWKPGAQLATWYHNNTSFGPRCPGSYRPGRLSQLDGTAQVVPDVPAPPREPVNTHEQLLAAGGGVAICVSHGGIRDTYVQGWAVYRVANGRMVVTDPKAPWYEHGLKVFRLALRHDRGKPVRTFTERRLEALTAAQAWVAAQGWYDGAWKRNAMGDFVPVAVQERFPIRRHRRNKAVQHG